MVAPMETLIDNFDDNSLSAQWTLSGAGTPSTQVKEQNQELEITSTGVSGDYDYCLSTSTYDLTGSSAFVRIVSAGSQATNFDYLPLLLQIDANNQLWWDINSSTLGAFKKVTSSQTSILTTAYSTTNHRWLRIREAGGTTFWEFSADGRAWILFTSQSNPIAVTALNGGIATGQFGAAAASTSKTDNFNIRGTLFIPQNKLRPRIFGPGLAR